MSIEKSDMDPATWDSAPKLKKFIVYRLKGLFILQVKLVLFLAQKVAFKMGLK